MFIGEGPGYNEDQQGRPFVGAAGKFLEQLIASAGMRRQDVYITNIVKCRPPQNRDPLPLEVDSCRPFLEQQVRFIRPKLITTLGRHSLSWFFPRDAISRVHGQLKMHSLGQVMPMYHPAAALHAGNMRAIIEEDFRALPAALAKAQAKPLAQAPESEPQVEASEQMRLF